MARFGFCGSSYTSQSSNVADERTLNLYPETVESQGGKSQVALYPFQGLKTLCTLVNSGGLVGPQPFQVRAMAVVQDFASVLGQRLFVIGGPQVPITGSVNNFYEIRLANGVYTPTLIGTANSFLAGTQEPLCSMCVGPGPGGVGTVFMTIEGQTYYWSSGAGFTVLPLANFGGTPVAKVSYCDGFFLALNINSNQFWASAPNDVTTWPGASTTKVSVFPDTVITIEMLQRQVWVLGQTASVVYFDSGNSPFPFDVIQGSYIEQGCGARASVVKLDNTLFWIGADSRGQAVVWRANGYTPQRVSNHAVEFAMQSYQNIAARLASGADQFNNGIRDAVGYAYQDQGHSFYQLYFPSANSGNGATWVYDVATQSWTERAFLNGTVEQAHRSMCHAYISLRDTGTNQYVPAVHMVGDCASGNIYQMSIPTPNGTGGWNFADDFGNPIKRLRRTPHINLEKEWMRYDELVLDLETGLGPIPPLAGTSDSPSVLYLQSPNGTIFSVTVTDLGAYVVTSGAIGTPQAIIINDSTTNTQSWKMSVTNGGVLFATSVPFNNVYPQVFPFATSGSLLQTGIQVAFGGASFPLLTPVAASRDPQVMLRWSKDGGHVWSNWQQMSAGQAGQYEKRVRMSRMGRARQMLFEVQTTDAIPWRFAEAYLKASGNQPEERLVRKLAKSA